ncbi:hypothetical protein FACS1894137_04170 [Spirochaetia bacterium]|nr:hypothetical protein FACS1894137_04170 [Spirochaetia bacterium]
MMGKYSMSKAPKKYPAWAGRDTEGRNLKTSYVFNIARPRKACKPLTRDVNYRTPIIFWEQLFLSRIMRAGRSLSYPYDFADHRNEVIYWNLAHLQTQLFLPGVDELIRYLREYRKIEQAGGESYIREIFRGVYPSTGRYYG